MTALPSLAPAIFELDCAPYGTNREPIPETILAPALERFYTDGAVILRQILTPEEVTQLRTRVDEVFREPYFSTTRCVKSKSNAAYKFGAQIVVHRLFETDLLFRDFLIREPIISIAETVLGANCHCIAQGCILNMPTDQGGGITGFHVDDNVEFPTLDRVPRHDSRLRMPVLRMSVQIALSDQNEPEFGPSEVVPGSHYSGTKPNDPENPEFEGQGPVPLLMRAGDLYLMNGQVWHRARPNSSERVRYLFHQVYGQRFVAQRFYPYLNYQMPWHVLEGADERLLRVLGKHPEGAYG